MFKALIIDQSDDNKISASVQDVAEDRLPQDGEVDIAVEYSPVNYKDGLVLNSDDVTQHPFRRRRRQRHERHLRKMRPQLRQLSILRPKLVPPFTDTVRLIDRDRAHTPPL